MGFVVMICFVWELNCGIGFAVIEKALNVKRTGRLK
jgi:hypothetical protein